MHRSGETSRHIIVTQKSAKVKGERFRSSQKDHRASGKPEEARSSGAVLADSGFSSGPGLCGRWR